MGDKVLRLSLRLDLAWLVLLSVLLVGTAQVEAEIYGWWKLDDGAGDTAADSGPNGTNGDIIDAEIGGLGDDGSVWVEDEQRGTVLGINGAYIEAGELPIMDLEVDFTWAFWAKPDDSQPTPNNNIIIGNRYGFDGLDTSPREFIKFTVNRFEYHMDAGVESFTNPDGSSEFLDDLQYLDCDYCFERHIDTSVQEWAHHAVVKDGDMLTYYRNGEEWNSTQIETPQLSPDPLPFNIGGQDARETWAGYLSDVRLFDHALSASEIQSVVGLAEPGDFDANGMLDAGDVNALLDDIVSGNNTSTFDLNSDSMVDAADLTVWVKDLRNTWIGDANLDGEFNSGDLVAAFTEGKYETGEAANWSEGDWNADGVFNSSDFVAAFSDGGYEQGPAGAVAAAVPEPASGTLGLIALCLLLCRRRTPAQ